MQKTKCRKRTKYMKRPPPHHIDTTAKPLPYPQRPLSKKNAMLRPIKRS